jgi:tetratricopeptide (TPR) repeat protein
MLPPLQMETIKNRANRERSRTAPGSDLLRDGGAGRHQIRRPKPEGRRNSEARNPKSPSLCLLLVALSALLAGCTPPGPRDLLRGQKLIEQGKYPEAVARLEAATSILTTNAQAWNYLGVACQYAGRVAEAEKAYQRAIALDHDLSEAHYNLGCLWLEQDRADAAKGELTAYTLRRGNALDALLKLGSAHLRSGDVPAAEKSFDDALHLLPENPEALNGLGLARVQRRRAGEAAQFFSRALKQRPGYGPALLNLAIVHQQYLKEPQMALQRYREYLALKPAPPNSEPILATVRQLEQEVNPPRPTPTNVVIAPVPPAAPPKAPVTNAPRIAAVPRQTPATNLHKPAPVTAPPATGMIEVVKLSSEPVFKPAQDVPARASAETSNSEPKTAPSVASERPAAPASEKPGLLQRINPANLFRSDSKSAPQVTTLPSANGSPQVVPATVTNDPGSAPLVAESASVRYTYKSPAKPASGNRPAAERYFAQGAQAQEEKKPAEAERAYRAATQVDPAYFEAQFNLGLAAAEAGHLSAALTAYEYALAIQPESADARYNFAIRLKQANHFTDAAHELEKLLARSPNETRAHLALGNLYAHQLNQPAQARAHYQKVLDTDPGHPQAGAIRYWLAANPP